MKEKTLALIFLFLFSSCYQSAHTKIVGNYFVDNLGDTNVKWLFFGTGDESGEGIIPGIKQIGFDNKYIIVSAGLQEYYIIEYKKNKKPFFDREFLIGPLNENDFIIEKRKRKINNLDFSILF